MKLVFAATPSGVPIDLPGTDGTVGQNFHSFGFIIGRIIYISGIIAGIILIFMFIYSGFLYMSSAGSTDTKKLARAQNSLVTSIAGFLIIFLTYFIIQIIQAITNVPILDGII